MATITAPDRVEAYGLPRSGSTLRCAANAGANGSPCRWFATRFPEQVIVELNDVGNDGKFDPQRDPRA